MLGIDVLLVLLIADEPIRAIDDGGIQMFIESHRTSCDGPGKIFARARGYYDSDSYPDKLVIYTYEHGPNCDDRVHGVFAVAFLTESFDTTEILFIPEAELVSDKLHGYSYSGNVLIITGEKRLPGDPMCCPSAIAVFCKIVVA
jgi:hypothetical protein